MSSPAVEYVGSDDEPIVVIDNFHPEPARLRALAQQAQYRTLSPYYPGVQAPFDARHLIPVDATISAVFRDVFGLTAGASVVQCTASLVTTPDADLAPIQRLPHVDTTDAGRIALLHYLSGSETGGTAFYRHRATGLDTLTPERFETYKAALESEGLPKPGYMRGSDERFEMIHHVAAKPNRAVLYRSRLLHSGMILEDATFSADPAKGRLTLNSFFQAKPA